MSKENSTDTQETEIEKNNNNEEKVNAQVDVIDLAATDDSDIEVLQVSCTLTKRRKLFFKRLKEEREGAKIHVKSDENADSYIKEEIIISDASSSSDDCADKVKLGKSRANGISSNLAQHKNGSKGKNEKQTDSLSSITLNCPRCNKTDEVFSTTIKSLCKDCNINMSYVCDNCNSRYDSMPALYRHKKLQCKYVVKLPRGKKRLSPRKLFIFKCFKCWYIQKLSCTEDKTCPKCNINMSYQCLICSKTYTSYSGLYRHVGLQCQPTTKTYYCNDCHFKTINSQNLLNHFINYHSDTFTSEYTCTKCCKVFTRSDRLEKHLISCGRDYFQCKFCLYKPKYQHTLKRHLIKYHKDQVNESNLEDILSEIVKEKDSKANPEVDYTISVEDQRKDKSNVHQLRKMYCSKCDKVSQYVLRQTNCNDCQTLLVYQCRDCEKRFKSSTSLYRHIRRIHGLISYLCPNCHKSFSFYGDVNTHSKTCGQEPRFECKMCSFKTRYNYNLQLHMKKLHDTNRRRFSCSNCSVEYKTYRAMQKHAKTCNNDSGSNKSVAS